MHKKFFFLWVFFLFFIVIYHWWNILQYIEYCRYCVSWYYHYRGPNIVTVSNRELPVSSHPYSPQTSEERNVPHQVVLLSCSSEVFYFYCSLFSNAKTAVILSWREQEISPCSCVLRCQTTFPGWTNMSVWNDLSTQTYTAHIYL